MKPPSKAQIKREQSERRHGIIDRVTSAEMHLIHDSQLYGSSLWPKKGFVAGWIGEWDKNETIKYAARVEFDQGREAWRAIYFTAINKSGARAEKQVKQLDLILDDAIYDGVHFTNGTPGIPVYHIDHYFKELLISQIHFNFTIAR